VPYPITRETVEAAQRKSLRQIYLNPGNLPYWGVHIAAVVGVAMVGFSWAGVAWALGLYFGRMFFVTGAYHRYFSHRTYKTSRWFQFLLGLGATTTVQKGILWWAAHHRHHHRASDQPDDLHSPVQGGFWWSHHGWILAHDFQGTDYDSIRDFARYPELRWLNRLFLLPPIALAVALFFIGGPVALFYGFFLSTVLLWHGTFTINSLSHVIGKRRYETTDDSRNHWLLALITMGEGWHNNHHHYQASTRQGFRWYEIDLTYYILRGLAAVGLVWDLKEPPAHVIENRPKEARVRLQALATARQTTSATPAPSTVPPPAEPPVERAA
jgi:stearoyl-CoA desaturase (Delta-9 desaturase)